MPGAFIRFLGTAALCVALAACGTSAVETVETPNQSLAEYRAVVVTVPLERGVDRNLARIAEASAVLAIKQSRRWRLVVAGSLAAGQKEGLNVEIDLRQQETGGFKEFTNSSSATVSLSDIATGLRLGGVSITASGASMEFTAKAIGEQAAAWVVNLP